MITKDGARTTPDIVEQPYVSTAAPQEYTDCYLCYRYSTYCHAHGHAHPDCNFTYVCFD